ncbi:phosphotransferase [Pseudonocardia broussonetiae]|uniref:Phosphotransferase n=1 Tax=Pseudonocardia broussonetiae TaxID=2736640 RepID=A0A6M6JDT1_9PSEU|nr:phosphotransferase [Pseudonocardia broussonetiae]QJY46104.1 phosphotransferase [Pseudonocardia broussonetiae]
MSARARAAAAVAEHAPGHGGEEWADLGGGLDHRAFRVGDLVVRVAAPDARAAVVREAALLRLVAGRLAVPVPEPRFADPARGVIAHRFLPGRPLLGRTPPADAATRLGRDLRALHDIGRGEVGDLLPVDPADPHEWLDGLTGPDHLLRAVRADVPRPADRLVPAHADLGAEHLLEDGGRLTGIIDWSDAAVTDPALDLARLLRDFGPAFLDAVLDAYGEDGPELRHRTAFFARCAALEDLAHGRDTGREEYSRAAERGLTWLFPDLGGVRR